MHEALSVPSFRVDSLDESSEFFDGVAVLFSDGRQIRRACENFLEKRGFPKLTIRESHQNFLRVSQVMQIKFLIAVALKISGPFLPFASFFLMAFLLWRLLVAFGNECERRSSERRQRQAEVARYLSKL